MMHTYTVTYIYTYIQKIIYMHKYTSLLIYIHNQPCMHKYIKISIQNIYIHACIRTHRHTNTYIRKREGKETFCYTSAFWKVLINECQVVPGDQLTRHFLINCPASITSPFRFLRPMLELLNPR